MKNGRERQDVLLWLRPHCLSLESGRIMNVAPKPCFFFFFNYFYSIFLCEYVHSCVWGQKATYGLLRMAWWSFPSVSYTPGTEVRSLGQWHVPFLTGPLLCSSCIEASALTIDCS
jgi:hypothetical protein